MTGQIAMTLALAWQVISPEAAEHARAGLRAQEQGHLAEAVTEFRKVTELAPQFDAAYVNLGAACLQNHAYGEAINPLRHALELNPALPGAHQMLGYALLAQGYAAEAIPHLEQTNTLDALGIAQMKTGKLPEAVETLEAALKQRPDDPDLLYYLSRASGLLSKNAFDELEGRYPDSARAHQSLGESYAALNRSVEAEKEFTTALKLRPDAPGIHLALGRLYTVAANWPKAEGEFRAEAKLQPGDSEAAYNLGQTLLQQGKLREARQELERADSLRPNMPETLSLLAKTESGQGDAVEAENAWKRVIAIEPDSRLAAQAHFGLASLYRKRGKQADAEREMAQFRKQQESDKAK